MALIIILTLAGITLYAGWRLFWFLTDDAFIAFRYISNSHLGYGYVWNPPPFKPLEGYTSFLWVVLLDVIWRVTGIEPPAAANVTALIFAGGTLALTTLMVLRLKLTPQFERWRLFWLALVLAATLSNRTFLAWTSSGLETAMFNFWLTTWVFAAVSLPPGNAGRLGLLASVAVLLELTRPDGLLFIAATALLLIAEMADRHRQGTWRPIHLAVFAPFIFSAAHLLWRRATYGQWVPNTYAAKYLGPWPESGWRYLLSFIIEYSLWLWPVLAGIFCIRELKKIRAAAADGRQKLCLLAHAPASLGPIVTIGTLLFHFCYYTFIIGGDHFEYRVYSHLVPLLAVSFVWLMNALLVRPAAALALLSFSLAASLPLPWTHWRLSQQYNSRLETWAMRLPLAPHFPAILRPYIQIFDDCQSWLIERAVCVRHQEHKMFFQSQVAQLPPRSAGLLLSPDAQAVRVEGAVGVIAWVLPTTAIIDSHGLNDAIIAHSPIDPATPRVMAHDRTAPDGYLECFEPNSAAPINKIIVAQRRYDLNRQTPYCETRSWPAPVWRPEDPNPNMILAPAAAAVLDNVWSRDPLFVYYVPPDQAPIQTAAELWNAFAHDFHDTGCMVFPPAESAADYQFVFLPPNLRYTPEELSAIFPWSKLVDFRRSGKPQPYNLAYAIPGRQAGTLPTPSQIRHLEWTPAMLLGYDLPTAELQAGALLETTLYLQARQPSSTEQWFRLGLTPADQPDTLLALDEGDPCRGLYPAPLWKAGQLIVSRAVLALPADLPPGNYTLRLSMFDLQTGPDQPLPITGGDGGILTTLTLPAH